VHEGEHRRRREPNGLRGVHSFAAGWYSEGFWLPDLDECENFTEIILFSLPRPLIAPRRPFPRKPKPAARSAIDVALEFQRLLDDGLVNSRAEIAERFGISRARVTQVLSLLKLPPKLLDLLAESGNSRYSERRLRGVLALPSQEGQIAAVRAMAAKPVETTSQPD